MKKLLLAAAASLGFATMAAAPASAGGSVHISGSFGVPVYNYTYPAPVYSGPTYYRPAPVVRYVPAPVYNYSYTPRYYSPAPIISFGFSKVYRDRDHKRHHKAYRGHQGWRHDRGERFEHRDDHREHRSDRRAERMEKRGERRRYRNDRDGHDGTRIRYRDGHRHN